MRKRTAIPFIGAVLAAAGVASATLPAGGADAPPSGSPPPVAATMADARAQLGPATDANTISDGETLTIPVEGGTIEISSSAADPVPSPYAPQTKQPAASAAFLANPWQEPDWPWRCYPQGGEGHNVTVSFTESGAGGRSFVASMRMLFVDDCYQITRIDGIDQFSQEDFPWFEYTSDRYAAPGDPWRKYASTTANGFAYPHGRYHAKRGFYYSTPSIFGNSGYGIDLQMDVDSDDVLCWGRERKSYTVAGGGGSGPGGENWRFNSSTSANGCGYFD